MEATNKDITVHILLYQVFYHVLSWWQSSCSFLTAVCKQFMLRWNARMCIGFYLLKTAFSCFASTLSVMLSLALPVATLSVMMLVLSSSSSLSDPLELLSDATSGAFLAPHTLHTHADEPLTATHTYWLTRVNGPFQERTNKSIINMQKIIIIINIHLHK